MSFLHARRSPIGALKSVREDKHGQGTGEEAETGGNKPGPYSGLFAVECGAALIEGRGVQTLKRKQPHSTANNPD